MYYITCTLKESTEICKNLLIAGVTTNLHLANVVYAESVVGTGSTQSVLELCNSTKHFGIMQLRNQEMR